MAVLVPPMARKLVLCWPGDLSFESERRADLVRSLRQVLGVERGAQAEGDAGAELDVVGERCDAAVVNLGLHHTSVG